MTGRYADDPLLQARRVHRGRYLGSPDGLCCIGCEGEDHAVPVEHVTWPCPVVNANRCQFATGDSKCIQSVHEGATHLVENRYGGRSVVTLVTD